MPRYKLRTLLILLAIGPPMLATIGPPLADWLCKSPPVIEHSGIQRLVTGRLKTS